MTLDLKAVRPPTQFLALIVGGMLAAVGCGNPDATEDPLVAGPSQSEQGEPARGLTLRELADLRFKSAGCTVATDPSVGMTRLHVEGDEWLLYDCRTLSKSARFAAHRAYWKDRGQRGGEGQVRAMATATSFTVTLVERVCGVTTSPTVTGYNHEAGFITIRAPGGSFLGEFWVEAGYYSVTFILHTTCTKMEITEGEEVPPGDDPPGDDPPPSGGGGGGGGGPPPPPVSSSDSCPSGENFAPNQDSLHITISGPLNTRSVQDSLAAAFAASIAPGGEINELGGVIVRTSDDKYLVVRLPPDPATSDNCSYNPLGGYITGRAYGRIIALWHTHPYNDTNASEEFTTCRLSSSPVRAQNSASGGGSQGINKGDWVGAATAGIPMYTIDRYNIYRLEPKTPFNRRQFNPNKWTRVANACALLVQS